MTERETPNAKLETPNGWMRWAPFLVLLIAAVILALRWQRLPERWIVHWGPGGAPDRWVTKDPFIVFIPLVAGLVLCVVFEVLATAISKRRHVASHIKASPEAAAQMAAVTAELVRMIALALAFLFTLLSIALPVMRPQSPGSVVITSLALMVLPVVIGIVRFRRMARALQSRGLIEAPDGWSALLYRNPGDSRLIVPKAFSPGYTINYAHPWAWPATVILIGLPLLVVLVLWKVM